LASVPTLLFVGGNDALVQPADFQRLLALLPASVKSKNIDDYNHLDYMWAEDINKYVNDDVRAFLASL
jgi:pimeloyl-ACP methyl ester carboxylesterase